MIMRSIIRFFAASAFVAAPLFAQPAANVPNEVVAWSSGVSYAYDPSGNVRQIGNDKFAFDHVGRLIYAKVNGVERSYEYDRYGNRQKCEQGKGTTLESDCQSYSIDSGNNRIIGAAYDPNNRGNVIALGIHGYTYDDFNMLTRDQAGDAREFIYTAGDERLATYQAGNRTWLWTIRDQSDNVLREFSSSGGANGTASFQWVKDFIWRDDSLLATMQAEDQLTTTYHYHLDHLGTPRRITDGNDHRVGFHDYFAFGPEKEGQEEPSFTPMRYAGQERDVASDRFGTLDYMHARYYEAELGRFLSVDPLRESAEAADPQTWNRYTYALNNPVLLTDPTGESTHTDNTGAVVAVYDDNDLGVYMHDDLSSWNKKDKLTKTGTGVKWMGETAYWDEFRAHNNKTGAIEPGIAKDARIQFGMSFDGVIRTMHNEAAKMSAPAIAHESYGGRRFDIKLNPGVAPYGPNTGRLLNGKYTTARSAGGWRACLLRAKSDAAHRR